MQVRDLKNSHEELKLFLDMFKRESTDPRYKHIYVTNLVIDTLVIKMCSVHCLKHHCGYCAIGRDIAEAKEEEYKAWARVESLKSSSMSRISNCALRQQTKLKLYLNKCWLLRKLRSLI